MFQREDFKNNTHQMYETVLHFWFREIKPSQWWKKNQNFDNLIKEKFENVYNKAIFCEFYRWRLSSRGRLAEIIILDQFSRNIYRNTSKAFQSDNQALLLAQEAISLKVEMEMNVNEKIFLYMPFMHSESLIIQKLSIKYFKKLGLKNNFDYAKKHYDVIKRFGRFPHRNEFLNRVSSNEEIKFLRNPGSRF